MNVDPEKVKTDFAAEQSRFSRLVPLTNDPLVIFLKGHLLIEEQLVLIIQAGVADSARVADARLTFLQKLHIAKAVAGAFLGPDIYDAIRRVNAVRNTLAHEAEPPDPEGLYAELMRWCRSQRRFSRLPIEIPLPVYLHGVLGIIWAYLTGVRDALRVVREKMPLPPAQRKGGRAAKQPDAPDERALGSEPPARR